VHPAAVATVDHRGLAMFTGAALRAALRPGSLWELQYVIVAGIEVQPPRSFVAELQGLYVVQTHYGTLSCG
jgi:hypothetical protein